MTLHTKPAQKTRRAISASTRSSVSLASSLLSRGFGSRAASAFSPPLRFAARSRMRLKLIRATSYSSQPSKKSNTVALNIGWPMQEK